jgi:cobalt-zinc-cadmium resistance protein CzcA
VLLDFVLRKRALVVALTLVLLALGIHSYLALPLEAYPDVANLQVRVITLIPGKAAEEMERLVTIPLEKELNGLPHSEAPRSISLFGLSVITVVFDDEVDPYSARQQVLEKISQADVPSNVTPQLDPNASPVGEVYRYTLGGKHWSPMAKKEWQDWVLDRKFKSVQGVVDVTGYGGPTKTFQVELDPDRLRALGLTQAQLSNAIASSNGSTGGSFIIQNDQDYMVRGLGLLTSIDDIKNVVVSSSKEGTPILVKDVASVSIGPAVRKGQVGMNEDDDVVEGIVLMRRGENPSQVVDNLKAAWPDIQQSLPDGMQMEPLYDRVKLVRKTMNTIGHNVTEGIVLVVVMLMLFMFQVRSALICATVIPLALSTAFILLNVFHVPGNLLSLGAIDFGIIVDGAIVMVENIVRHLSHLSHEKKKPTHAEIINSITFAAKEVARPILFATSIIICTFLPILTFEKVEGKLFRPLAVTMNFNLIGAVLASMTIIPVMCAIVFGWRAPVERVSPLMKWAESCYEPVLRWSMKNRFKVIAIALSAIIASFMVAPFLGSEFIPELEEGNIWLRVTVLPNSVSLDKSVEIAREIRKVLRTYPEVTNVVSQIGTPDDGTDPNNYSNIEVFVDLHPQEEWTRFKTKQDLVTAMNKELTGEMPGLLYNFSQYIKDNMDEAIAGVKGELGIKIYGHDLQQLSIIGTQVKQIVEKVPGIVDVANDQLLGQPQLLVSIDRERAARYGINTQDILDVVETSVGGKQITELIEGERRFAVMLRFQKGYRNEASDLGNIQVATPSGNRIPLQQLASITEAHGASVILREKNERRVAVKANIRGRDLMSAVKEAQKLVKEKVKFPEGYKIVWGGQFERAEHAMGRLALIVPLTLGLIFILLYAATGSANIALLVMLTVPLAIPGAIFALYFTHTHFSISAGVGMIALFGVATQNGVILVSLVKYLVADGYTLQESIFRSALVRFKPALMTTAVAMAGLIPAAISNGIGSQSQKPFAIVIVGGLIPAIFLSLMVLPAMYEWFDKAFTRDDYAEPEEPEQETGAEPH